MIYFQEEINFEGNITKFAFNKSEGDITDSISDVSIYMKHTTATSLTSGTTSTSGYTQVFNGSFPNNSTSGWMEIELDEAFPYNNDDNLQIFIIVNQASAIQWPVNEPKYYNNRCNDGSWQYRLRQYRSPTTAWTTSSSLTYQIYRPDIRIVLEDTPVCLAPIELNATNITYNTADVSWTVRNGENNWDIVVRLKDFDIEDSLEYITYESIVS